MRTAAATTEPDGRAVKIRHCRGCIALAAALILAACSTNTRTDTSPTTSPESSPTPTSRDGAYFLELRTGAESPLSRTSVEDFGSGAPFHAAHYYVVSPDRSRIYWEDGCCTAEDVAMEASKDASQGRRLDPAGPINHYAGGWSPDGRKFVYQRRDGRGDDVGNLFVADSVTGRVTRITDLAQRTRAGWWYLAPTFTPDSKNVIFQSPQDTPSGERFALWSVPATGGKRTLLFENAAQATTSSGSTYAFVRPIADGFQGSSLVIATPTGVRTLVQAKESIFEPKMSPDGTSVAYGDGGSILVVDVSTGKSSKVAAGRMAAWVDDDTLIIAPQT